MKKIIVVGSGIAGLSACATAAEQGAQVLLMSPMNSERSQSVMAAGGINAALGEYDSVEEHIKDTFDGGCGLGNIAMISGLCSAAPGIVRWLDEIGTVFSRNEKNDVALRAFGGQKNKRTAYAGASTGKQIVTALTRLVRKYECKGQVERRLCQRLIDISTENRVCNGAVFYDSIKNEIYGEGAAAVILATGGQNTLFGKTTGSTLCDAGAAAVAFCKGARLKNLEMIQYHPTTAETEQKKLLISEAARGEGGRLYYEENGNRVYFMEDKYGERGNLMPRDIVSREIFSTHRQCYLDITFLGEKLIKSRLLEIYDLCKKYLKLDVTSTPIPVTPSVHFFMGGLEVDAHHQTTIKNLFAAGECACAYHGANRLGGNSLLAAIYSGRIAAENAFLCADGCCTPVSAVEACKKRLCEISSEKSKYPPSYFAEKAAQILTEKLGIVRNEGSLQSGVDELNGIIEDAGKIIVDQNTSPYDAYVLLPRLYLAKAVLLSATERRESIGAHFRSDFLQKPTAPLYSCASFNGGEVEISFKKEEV